MKPISVKSIGAGFCVLTLGLVLAGCGGQSAVQPAPGGAAAGNESQTSGMNQGAMGEGQPLTQNQPAATETRPAQNVVYFDFDQSDIKPQYTDLLTQTSNYLVAHPDVHVRLEGYTDERGTKAYNIALGDRRAQSVKRFLMLQGVADNQMETVSYGEEDPADPGHNEAAWAKNRRVVIVYLQ
ncbi:MAG TPA: peptidoglycan-associated lipoprotein Pal [Gammaproteobacteria bacterium]|jgi:peptidoglycan-associated lipoprotein|nr:peptidoglycan-associated lipoprotein Pal [Gammaproteobacteria bacterium]